MEERRRFVRWQINSPASVQIEGEDNPFDCNIEDINPRGMKMHSAYALKPESNLRLKLALNPKLSLDLEAAVAWDRVEQADHVCGLCFTRMQSKDREKIFEFVQQNFPEQISQQFWKGVR